MKNIRLSHSSLKRLVKSPPSASKNFMWDLEIPGFGAYLTSVGRVSFVYQYRMPGGKPQRFHIGYLGELTIDGARDRARDLAHKRRHGTDPIAEIRAAQTEEQAASELVFSTYAENYIERRTVAGKPLTKAQIGIIHGRLFEHFGSKRIDRITSDEVETFTQKMAAISASAHRSTLIYLKVVLNDAVKRRKIAVSPARIIETPQGNERDRVLRRDEVQRFIEAAHDLQSVQGAGLLAIARMLKRKEEVLAIKWEEIDQSAWTWSLAASRTKNREAQKIMLPHQVVEIFESQQPDKRLRVGFIFTLNGRNSIHFRGLAKAGLDANMNRRLQLANEAHGTAHKVEHYTLHDLRTAGATRLQEEPFVVSSEIIDAILLHKAPGKVTRTYQRSKYFSEAGAALQQWNDYLDDLMRSADAWPGGKDLPKLSPTEVAEHLKAFRRGWPKRANQKQDDDADEA